MSTFRVARPSHPRPQVDRDARDRLDRQARLLECALEGLVAMGSCFEIRPADLTPLIGHVEGMRETIARLQATRA